jgi:tungstate transport system ATP-binding protein
MSTDPLYRLTAVTKTHGPNFTLRIPELNIGRGDVLSLLGPTGAGKTTLLRLLAGLERATAGDIDFESRAFPAPKPSLATRRRIAMVHQRPALLTGTVRFNVEYGLRLRGLRERCSKVDELLDRLRLSSIASQNSQSLSGGQVQLVSLARSLVVEPEVLLLDEPTSHLDPAHVALVEDALRQLRQQRPMTILWATHNLFQARRVSTRTALLWDGQLIETAPTIAFFDSPSDPRTMDFVQGRLIF